jgi:hypothetical protein
MLQHLTAAIDLISRTRLAFGSRIGHHAELHLVVSWPCSTMGGEHMRQSDRSATVVAVCLWCDLAFAPRNSGGYPQRFCCADHRRAFHIAAHQYVLAEFAAGRVTVAAIKKSADSNRIFSPVEQRVASPLTFSAPEKSSRRDDHSGAPAENSLST